MSSMTSEDDSLEELDQMLHQELTTMARALWMMCNYYSGAIQIRIELSDDNLFQMGSVLPNLVSMFSLNLENSVEELNIYLSNYGLCMRAFLNDRCPGSFYIHLGFLPKEEDETTETGDELCD